MSGGVEQEDKPGKPPVINIVDGQVIGNVLQANNIYGGLHMYHDPVRVHVVVPAADEARRSFGGGARWEVDDRVYLLHDHLAEENFSAEGATVRRQARVAVLGDPHSRLGWFRQVEDRHGTGAGRVLADERDLLADAVENIPGIVQFHQDDRTSTLVTTWPRERSGRPCDSLDVLLDDRLTPDSGQLHRWCDGLAGLCEALGALHDRGITHRGLSPTAIVACDDGRFLLRDLGLAAHGIRIGEHRGDYQ
ncbi:MAG: serine/threonine-protein kinase, partial [Actinomycetota bacterium]|nr:serine/threonine-protein kinase [Actinomycetota bacterium]